MSRTSRSVPAHKFTRHPKTTQELRDSEACRVDGIKKRKARAKRRLPTTYNDLPIAARNELVEKC
jgi:hypothetical protein